MFPIIKKTVPLDKKRFIIGPRVLKIGTEM